MNNSEEVKKFLDRLSVTEKTVIVEGKKDEKALKLIGVRKVFCLNKKPLFAIAEDVASQNKKVIILTDLDKEGRRIYGKLKTYLQRSGVEIDNQFREFLFRNTKIRQIEGLSKLYGPCYPGLAVVAKSSVTMNLEYG